MSNTTLGYPYVSGTSSPAGHTQVQALAEAVDTSPGVTPMSDTTISGLGAELKRAGRVIWKSTGGKLAVFDGANANDLALAADLPVASSSTPSATSTSGAAGSNATFSKSDHVHALGSHDHSDSSKGGNIPQASVTGLAATISGLSTSYAPLNLTVNAQGGAYQLVASDAAKLVTITSASPVNVTVPVLTLPTGASLVIAALGSGQVTLVASGTSIAATPGLKLRAQNSVVSLVYLGSNAWLAAGDLSA